MKISLASALFLAAGVNAFVGPIFPTSELPVPALSAISRRSVIVTGAGFILGTLSAPGPSHSRGTANPFFGEEINFEPSQQAKGDKIDINGAFVVDYKQFPGMYPSAAGKIASHGPYKKVDEIYSIPGVSDHDKMMFNKYKNELTVLPPGRMFDERINQRQST